MSSITQPTSPASTPAPRSVVSQLERTARFTANTVGITLRKGMFLFFTIALPVAMFLLFNSLFGGSAKESGVTMGAMIMVRMAAYGGVGAAVNSGAIIQLERSNGWLSQLTVAGLRPRSFVIGKLIAAMVVVLPALIAVFLAGELIGIHSPLGRTTAAIAVVWVSMIPMVLLGLVIGLALKPSAVQPASTIAMMGLSVLGGLWVPIDMFGTTLQAVARLTPTYWIGELGTSAVAGGGLPVRGVLTLVIWGLALAVACAFLLGRAARSSSRR